MKCVVGIFPPKRKSSLVVVLNKYNNFELFVIYYYGAVRGVFESDDENACNRCACVCAVYVS